MWGNELENDGAAWIEAKCIFPTLSLTNGTVKTSYIRVFECTHESPKPNVALAWFRVIRREILTTFR